MSDQPTLHTNPRSRGAIVRWMLEEIGAPYQVVYHEYGDAMRTPEFLAMNKMAKVPVLKHGDKTVTECAAICAYLADAAPAAGLAPPPAERADYYRWMFFVAGPFEAAVVDRALGLEHPVEKRAMSQYGAYESVMDALQGALEGRSYIAADQFTAADVYVGAHMIWGLQFNTVEKRPGFEEYAERLKARAAYKRAAELDATQAT